MARDYEMSNELAIRLLTIFSHHSRSLPPAEYIWFLLVGDWCLNSHFSLDCACASAMTLHAFSAVSARTASVARGFLGLRKDRTEGNSPNRRAEGTISSGLSVSLQGLTARLSKNSFFSLGCSIRRIRKVRLIGSYYLSLTSRALWCCAPDLCHSTSWISQISTKVSLNREPSWKT